MGIDRAQTQKEHYIHTQEKRIDLYFKYNLKDYHSMKVIKFKKNPMGGYFIKGYLNNDKNYDFDATIFLVTVHNLRVILAMMTKP